jgi:hypothetical protein
MGSVRDDARRAGRRRRRCLLVRDGGLRGGARRASHRCSPGPRRRLLPGRGSDRRCWRTKSQMADRAAVGDRPTVVTASLGGGPVVDRVAVEPAARGRRSGGDLRRAAPRRNARGGRQHVCHTAAPTSSRAWGRHRRALRDQAHRRALGSSPRSGRYRGPRRAGSASCGPRPERSHARDARVLPGAARCSDTRVAAAPGPKLGATARGTPGRPRRRHPGAVPGLRHDRQLRAHRRGSRRSCVSSDPHHSPRDEPRRRRDIDGAPQRAPRPGTSAARSDPTQRRMRGPRRPEARSRIPDSSTVPSSPLPGSL